MAYDQDLADTERRLEACRADLAAAIGQLHVLRGELDRLRVKAVAVAEEYEREPRMIASGAVAGMLREWVGEYR